MVSEYNDSDIPSVHNLKNAPTAREEVGFRQVIARGLDQMIGLSWISPERQDADPHTHSFEQMNLLIDGRLDFLVDGERVTLEPYDTLVIPPGVPHTSRAVDGSSATLLAFWPLREDRVSATAYQQEFDM